MTKNDEIYIINISNVNQKNKKNKRYYVETTLDNYYLDEDTIVNYFITKGKIYKEDEFKEILYKAKVSEGFNKALNYLARAKKSTYEIKEYLRKSKWDFDNNQIEEIINKLKEYGYLNDYDYALSVLNTYGSVKGPKYIEQKLISKRIHQNIIKDVISKFICEDEKALAMALLIQKNNDFDKQPMIKQKTKIYNRLLSKGFSVSSSTYAISKLNFVENYDDELDILVLKQINKYSSKFSGYELKQKVVNNLLTKGYNKTKILDSFKKNYEVE